MVIAQDYDKDGDVDIAAISFFPDFVNAPETGFVYFENNNGTLEPYTTAVAAGARWLVMETVDVDADGYTDIILGAINFDTSITDELKQEWAQNPIDILVLKNKGKK
jgi:hypothetical protein